MANKIRPIAIHLPQFHPFPENDEWWGKGFTEWTNVTKAKPLFEGHYQPHLPADLGFYDLRLEEARLAQEALAKEYGIYGFCYYHYWFNGKRLMHEPIDRKLKNPKEDLPFMLCWANENWSRAWDGSEKEILIAQNYSAEDDAEHIRFLLSNVFNDKRYIRIDNKIFFAIYRPAHFPELKKTLQLWRNIAKEEYNEELFLVYMKNANFNDNANINLFDSAIDFQPDFQHQPNPKVPSIKERVERKFFKKRSFFFDNKVISYKEYYDKAFKNQIFDSKTFPGITPMWDNSARRQIKALVMNDSTPELYGDWLQKVIAAYKKVKSENKYIFINAWNEWAEGNHIEPCRKWGRRYLEVTKEKFDQQ
ncbi:glycoside hydrolase family 99-like domain-containing protein [Chryseobacterium sp. SC28]|uniref:glycoside hydrolase family 99-like domain-containing protein n=1 Tax=Chryseobacterium sp. SC28 TaxID=2268028 RepID=UPI000F655D0D|nr:glycoside hydrolase family 99-like domain-containing protein [Chryseobacterium sp. SC28]RRQ45845.1 glycosyl hydrolase [Chryseobacterium sp. SC28]